MAVFYSQSFATAIVEMLRTRMANGGKLRVYDGTRPATPDVAVSTQNLLAEFDIPAPAFDAPVFDAVANVVVLPGLPIPTSPGLFNGIGLWARMSDSNNAPVYDGNCGNLNSSAMFKIVNTSIVVNAPISISAHSFTQPKA